MGDADDINLNFNGGVEMRSWKEVPNLFANRKFKIIANDTVCTILSYETHGNFYLYSDKGCESQVIKVSGCTLIARKIEDMTDEETSLFGRYGYIDDRQPDVGEQVRKLMSDHASMDYFSPSEFIQFLQLGVYPFDQKAFETGEVIDIKTLTNEE